MQKWGNYFAFLPYQTSFHYSYDDHFFLFSAKRIPATCKKHNNPAMSSDVIDTFLYGVDGVGFVVVFCLTQDVDFSF